VFTQFDRKDDGRLEPLPNKNIDTGMGLERIARVMQGKKTNFEIDSFVPIVEEIVNHAGRSQNMSTVNAIADHIRAVTFAIGDGVLPSNEERGYVIRKLIRKAFWYGRDLGLEEPFLYRIVPIVAKVMKKPYPELIDQREDIAQVVLAEEKRFRNTIQEGLEKLETILESCPTGIISGEEAFRLYDTYGFPLELTQEIAGKSNIKVDVKGFEDCMDGQREKSRQTSKIKESIFTVEEGMDVKLPGLTPFIEDEEEIDARVIQVSPNNDFIFLEKTNFYGEKGGQVGDTGWLLKEGDVVAEVVNAVDIAGRVQHQVKMKKGMLRLGDIVTAKIDKKRRENIRKNHTATHLLHHALRTVLGQHVKQSGSLVAPDRLRFDFRHFCSLADEEIFRVEQLVNENIIKNSNVDIKELALEEAKQEGAIALFGQKYAERVRMVSVGDYSKELCGGTHVKNTKDIGRFKIISESSIASGIRRIEALTGEAAEKKIREEEGLIREVTSELKTTPDNILEEIERVSRRIKKIEKALDEFSAKNAQLNIDTVLQNCKKIKDYAVIVAEIKNADMGILRKSGDAIRAKLEKAVFVLVSEKDGRLLMVSGAPSPLNAVKLLNEIGSDFGIKGGGRPDFGQAGAKSGPGVSDMLKKAEQVIARYL
jgi:alanyl-tRNA synthetase